MKKFIFALALFVCANSVTLIASDLSEAKRDLKSAQKELSSVISKRDKVQQQHNQLQEDYEGAVAKVAANQDKPKSLAYKNAVKKSDELNGKVEQNAQLLASLNRQVDSLQNIVVTCESALTQAQQAEENENRVETVVPEEPLVEQPAERDDKRDAITLLEDNSKSNADVSKNKESSQSTPKTFWQKVWSVIKIIFWIIIGIIVLRILMKIGGKSGGSSVSGGDKDAKKRQIASIQAEIAKLQADIASAKSWERQRGAKQTKIDIDRLKHSIALKKAEIARIKARR